MRWLLVKDLQILRRSPLLVGLLIVYPIAIALMIGFALSSPPGKPKVAFLSQVAAGHGRINFGSQQINVSKYANQLFQSIEPVKVSSRDEAIAKVKNGEAQAALIIPADITNQVQSLVTTGVGSPTVELILNSRDPVERQFADQAIKARLNDVEQAVSKQVLRVATNDLQQVLNGGTIQFLGQNFTLLGLRNSRTILQAATSSLPKGSALRPALSQVVGFANLAIEGLGFASPVLGSIGTPLTVEQTQLAGRTTPTDTYAGAIAVIVSLMFVTILLAAGLLALERSENAYSRLVRGLVSPGRLLSAKVALAAGAAAALALLMSAFLSIFIHLDWARLAIGALAREVSAASLLGILTSLPIAFVALVPASAVSGALKTVLDAVAFVFPFKAALQAASNAFSGTQPGIVWPLVHLAVLTVVFGALARVALRRFAD
jgi:hypothetical protein